ncbi:hypothetical protein ASD98_02320 [Flavobacterium sp. Root186]|nr:hypothetical protein ASD98_02320 [Flavobacterium sp. Root186]
MKNNTFYKVDKQKDADCFIKGGSLCGFCFLTGLLFSYQGHAQFYNKGEVLVKDNTILSVYENYQNDDSGAFTNDGEVYIFKDWNNNGVVNFTNAASNGSTLFKGTEEQMIEGDKQSDFQNVVFDNKTAGDAQFHLGTTITVGNKAEFIKGIVDAAQLEGLVIFNENAVHEKAGDQSFVDGKVQKKGKKDFEYPVGADKYFRPSFHGAAASNNIYTTQYFHKNSADLHSHSSKDDSILEINDQEYWEVRQDQGAEKIVLSLSLGNDTTPSQFFAETSKVRTAIVRWDEALGKWVNDKGVLSDPINGEPYSRLLTGAVGGYGIFTTALVKAEDSDPTDLIVYNAVSPNGDGINDTFHIKGINKYPDNSVEIYNRWGVKVYDAKSYNESTVMFAGYSDGRATINRGEKLPTGTYFYILKYNNGKKAVEKSGYLYINNQ